jgi:murein DD-endopeptidase MepM/ murein hydrolase activator NlpD
MRLTKSLKGIFRAVAVGIASVGTFFLVAYFIAGRAIALAQTVNPTVGTMTAASSTNLQTQLQQKEQQLSTISQQLTAAKSNLSAVQGQRVTLQQQVNLLNGNINTLSLNIQADTLTSQQLEIEKQQLAGNIQDIASSVNLKQAAIASTLQELQRNDTTNGNLLALFLKSGTLADSVFEANSILNLQNQLDADIGTLKGLNTQYNDKLQQSSDKEVQIEAQQQDLQSKKSIVLDQQQQKALLLATTKNQESVFQKQLTALQQQQAQINSDIESIDAVLRTKIDATTLPALGAGVLLMPVQGDTEASITQGYGATSFAQTEYVKHWHNGLDLAASIGTPLLAADDGVVAAQGNEDLYCPHGAYGKFVVINHYNGLTTLYGHMSKILVTAGEKVTRGQLIGYSGNTGDVTGPHLHFTVFAQSTYNLNSSKSCGPLPTGGDLDPSGYLF